MIKCIGYLKSLKQLLFILLISCFIFGLGCFASAKTVYPIGQYGELAGGNTCTINSNLSINCYVSNNVMATVFDYTNSLNALFWSDGGIGFLFNQSGNSIQKLINSDFFICSGNTQSFLTDGYNITTICPPGFTKVNISTYTGLINILKSSTPNYWFHQQDYEYTVNIGLIYDDFIFSINAGGYTDYIVNGSGIIKDFGFGNGTGLNDINFINSNVLGSPISIVPGLGNGGVELSSTQGALDYYENYYGWNSDICYLGVNSMSYLWGATGVSFNKGGGLNIFEGFSELYSGSDLDHVYVWVNSWLINYNNWFNRSDPNEPPLYLVNYDYNNNSVSIYYDNLNFPFSNNPLGVYFMTNYIDSKSSLCDSSCGSDVVSYCNIKLNGGTFEDIIDNSSKESIDQYVSQKNIHNGLNSDGTDKTSTFTYTYSGNDYTGAVEFINFYVGKLNNLINTSYDGPGFIPTYIILFMLALIFFRFMSH